MRVENSSLFSELDSICQRIALIEWKDQDVALKRKAANSLRKLSVDLGEPGDLIDRVIYQPMDNALLRLALDLNLFEIHVETHGAPINTATLAKETGVDPILLQRILSALNAMGAVKQIGADAFKANKFSKAFTTQKEVCGAKFSSELATPAWNQLPAYLANKNYHNLSNQQNTAAQLAFNQKAPDFGNLQERPETSGAFVTDTTVQRDERPNFTDFFPADKQLGQGFDRSDKDAVIFVDVGGGRGHETLELRKKFPHLRGRMIVQDRPEVIRDITDKEGIEVMEHDFFKPQPVKGARAYYFRHIFHQQPTERCVKILRQTIAAMKGRYSKLLINELLIVILDDNNDNASTFMTRSADTALHERPEAQWRALLGSVGLKIVGIWSAAGADMVESESIIECVLSGWSVVV